MFSRILEFVRSGIRPASHSRRQRPARTRRVPRPLHVEQVEDRRLMAVFPTVLSDIVVQPTDFELARAEGSITYNPATRAVTIEGTPQHNDRVSIVIDRRGTATTTDDQISILLANINSPLVRAFNFADVGEVVFHGYAGDDFVDNKTITKLRAYAGDGNDVLLGGFGDDVLLGGAGHDYLDGRRGGDMMWGEAGHDALFGDDGIDMLLGGLGNDTLHGGNGIDSLYGELGNDWLFGGAGLDTLTDNSGTNQKFADYGTNTSTILGYYRFDWFDKNLQNPDLRSAVRLAYRDNFFMRDDALAAFKQVSTDNYVSTTELADLKDLLSTQLTVPADVRFFIGKIVNGDRANGWYQGQVLGNLAAGVSGAHLDKLVDKWMKGGDLPATQNPDTTYRRVSGKLFVSGATFADIDQGRGANDCYFLAALGEVAQHRLSTIQNMFIDNGDGTYGVRFFKGTTPFYVTVNSFLPVANDTLGAQFAGWGGGTFTNLGNELWVALAEKAYVQLNESGWIGQDGTNAYPGIAFGYPGKAFSHIAAKEGGNRTFYNLSLVKNALIQDIMAGKAITVATKDSGVDADVSDNHAYMLVGFDSLTQTFELCNPHGTNGSLPVRLFMSFSDLVRNCSYWTQVSLW
jgi:hypothetical protein